MVPDTWDEAQAYFDHLGPFVGELSTEDAIRAIAAHEGRWIVQVETPDGDRLPQRSGWLWTTVESETHAIFALAGTEQGAGNPAVFLEAPLVLSFAKGMPVAGECSQHTGGLVIRSGFGDYAGYTITLLSWHDILHVTESGDVAPGFGDVSIDLREIDPDDAA